MSRLFYQVMQDNVGNLLFDVSGTMRLAGTGTLATIYGDEALTVVLPNPMTNHPSFGSFKCFLGAGDYDFYMAKAGYTFETLTGVQGHGTLAQQDAGAVAITGGSATGLTTLGVTGTATIGGNTTISGLLGVRMAPGGVAAMDIAHNKGLSQPGIIISSPNADVGAFTMIFTNTGATVVGSIAASGTATAYNTSSDRRLKDAITPLTEALATVLALAPVQFLWKADGTPGHGFVADEVQTLVPEAVSGEAEAVDAAGQIVPQQLDASKLVVFLVGAVQELAQRLVTLETARA